MKYYGKTAILIPYINDDDKPDWIRITLDTPKGIYVSKVYSGIKKYILDKFGVKVDTAFVKKHIQIYNESAHARTMSPDEKREFMDKLVRTIQEEEDKYAAENGGYFKAENAACEKAEVEMPTVQSESSGLS